MGLEDDMGLNLADLPYLLDGNIQDQFQVCIKLQQQAFNHLYGLNWIRWDVLGIPWLFAHSVRYANLKENWANHMLIVANSSHSYHSQCLPETSLC